MSQRHHLVCTGPKCQQGPIWVSCGQYHWRQSSTQWLDGQLGGLLQGKTPWISAVTLSRQQAETDGSKVDGKP